MNKLLRPSLGSWVSYGLGTKNENLPGFVSITLPTGHGGDKNYGALFLPAHHQVTTLGHSGNKIEDATIRFFEDPTAELSEQQRQLQML